MKKTINIFFNLFKKDVQLSGLACSDIFVNGYDVVMMTEYSKGMYEVYLEEKDEKYVKNISVEPDEIFEVTITENGIPMVNKRFYFDSNSKIVYKRSKEVDFDLMKI